MVSQIYFNKLKSDATLDSARQFLPLRHDQSTCFEMPARVVNIASTRGQGKNPSISRQDIDPVI
jgi:hypothetical protein